MTVARGTAGERGGGVRRRRRRSGARGGKSREGGKGRGRVREVGRIGTSPGIHPRGQGKQEVARGSRRWRRGGARASARAVPLSGRKTTKEGGPGGLGRLLAGPACCCWAAQGRGGPGKFLYPFLFSFLIF